MGEMNSRKKQQRTGDLPMHVSRHQGLISSHEKGASMARPFGLDGV
jgi:hypothetical protein